MIIKINKAISKENWLDDNAEDQMIEINVDDAKAVNDIVYELQKEKEVGIRVLFGIAKLDEVAMFEAKDFY